jgi:hypothetical protein
LLRSLRPTSTCPSWIGCEFAIDLKLLVTDSSVCRRIWERSCASIRALDLTSTEAILPISSEVYVEYLKVTMERESPISAITRRSTIFFLEKIIPANGQYKAKMHFE